MNLSILLTSFKEPQTIAFAIKSLTNQGITDYELLISAPDEETLQVARAYAKKNKKIKVFQDKGKGKPVALNLLLKKARGKILVLTDGDVLVQKNALKNLIIPFKVKGIGAVSGQVISSNDKETMFGYWAHLLTRGFDLYRLSESEKGKVVCSGYLYAIRNGIVKSIPEDTLADDAYISLFITQKGFPSVYAPQAKVLVKYPTTLPDWISQKKRTAARTYQLSKKFKISKLDSLKSEVISGVKVLRQINGPRYIAYFAFLAVMRIYIWARVFLDFRLWNRSFSKTWQRVESTK